MQFDRELKEIFAVSYEATRDGFAKRTGDDAPAMDWDRQLKKWWDPRAAIIQGPRQYVYTVIDTDAKGQPVVGPDGTVQTKLVLYDRSDAIAVNYAPLGTSRDLPYEEQVPLNLSGLKPDESLVRNSMGVVVIRNMKAYAAANAGPGDFTPADRANLNEILDWVRKQKAS